MLTFFSSSNENKYGGVDEVMNKIKHDKKDAVCHILVLIVICLYRRYTVICRFGVASYKCISSCIYCVNSGYLLQRIWKHTLLHNFYNNERNMKCLLKK